MPDPTSIDDEWVTLDAVCDGPRRSTAAVLAPTCTQSLAGEDAAGTVIVVGDSHAQQWMGAILPIAHQQRWNVVALLKGGCSFAADEPPVPGAEECERWRAAAQRYILQADPVVVFGMATKTAVAGPGEWELEGLDTTIAALSVTGADIVLFRDNPRFDRDIFECVVRFGDAAAACRVDRADALARSNPAARLESGRVHVVDLSDYLCPGRVCPPVIGNVAVYMDDNHLTRMYATSLAPMLERDLEDASILRSAG